MNMTGYTKLFASIVHSTVWRAPNHIRLVWVTMLALADKNGLVEASIPGLADAARVSLDECLAALENLSSPDPYSRTKEHEGRRIAEAEGGWALLNYRKYRDKMSAADQREKTRVRVANWRAAQKGNSNDCNESVPAGDGSYDIAEAEAKGEADPEAEEGDPPKPPATRKGPMPPDWAPNDTAKTRAAALNLDVEEEADDYREWTTAKGMKYAGLRGWDAGFLNHLRSRAKWAKERDQQNTGRRSEQEWAKTKEAERQSPPYHKLFKDQDDEDEDFVGEGAS